MDNPAPPGQAPPSPAPPAPPTAPPAPAAGQTPPAAPPVVPLTVDEYQRLRGVEEQFKTFQASQAIALQEAENKRLKLLADKEGAEKALTEQHKIWETKLAEKTAESAKFQQAIFEERKETVFADHLAGRQLYGDTDEHRAIILGQVKAALRGRFEAVHDASGKVIVREVGTGMPAEHVLPKLLDSIEFAHYFKAKGKGGTLPAAPTPYNPTKAWEPGSLDDIAERFRQGQGQYPAMGLGPVPSKQ